MAAQDLHQVTLALRGAFQALEKIMAEAEPFELAYIEAWKVAHDPATGEVVGMTEEEWKAHDVSIEYDAFYDAADAIQDLMYGVEERLGDAQGRWWRTAVA